jgi:hypothetical protein
VIGYELKDVTGYELKDHLIVITVQTTEYPGIVQYTYTNRIPNIRLVVETRTERHSDRSLKTSEPGKSPKAEVQR